MIDVREPGDEPIPSEFTTDITLFNTVYSPYAHSYLCWGKFEALRRYRARLLITATKGNRKSSTIPQRTLIRDPCLPNGTNETLTLNQIFQSPCTANEKEQFNQNYSASIFIFMGAGNASQCKIRLQSLFDAKKTDTTTNCTFKQDYCTFDHTFQPTLPKNINFIGLSGYYYVFHNLAHRMYTKKVRKKKMDQISFLKYF